MEELTDSFINNEQHHCFLCLDQSNDYNDKPSVSKSIQLCSLQLLLRHLNMDIHPSLPLNGDGENNSNLNVGLCRACASHVEHFSRLYQQLENIRMEMESSLIVIQGKLINSGEPLNGDGGSCKATFTRTGSNPGVRFIENLKLADLLPIRREMTKKCASKLLTTPRVQLQRLTNEQTDNHSSDFLQSQPQSRKLEGMEEPSHADDESFEEASDPDSDYEMENSVTVKNIEHSDDTGDDESDNAKTEDVVASKKKVPEAHFNLGTGKHCCPACPKQFTEKRGYIPHYRSAHLQIKFRCPQCPKEFNYRTDYNRHYKSSHLNEDNNFKCPVCGKYFTTKSSLRVHNQTAHLKLKVKCKWCPVSFTNGRNRRRHMQSRCPNRIMGDGDADAVLIDSIY